MTDEQITALAREYAEELYPNLSDKIISLRTQEIRNAERLIRFLLRRYALVEKSKLKEAYKDAQKDQHNSERDFALTIAGRNRSAVLIDLFPDLGKQEKDADTVIQGWVARDATNDLYIYDTKPGRIDCYKAWDNTGFSLPINDSLFPDLTWSDEPQEVEIIIKRKKK